MVYYAYAKTSHNDWSHRYLIIAADINVLDEWFKVAKEKVADGVITRVGDDFFVFDHTKFNLGRSTIKETPHFMNKMIFQLMSDNEHRNCPTFINAPIS